MSNDNKWRKKMVLKQEGIEINNHNDSQNIKHNRNLKHKHNNDSIANQNYVHAMSEPISHQNLRLFKPEKLSVPRDFKLPPFILAAISYTSIADIEDIEDARATKATDEYIQFKLKRPLVVEVGAGKGRHALLYAKKNPNKDIIAIERTTNKFAAFTRTLTSERLNNLVAVHADAIPYCVYALPAYSVSEIFILYPNPEPKNPNQHWLNMPFFEFLLSRLKEGGKLVLASNIESYIENAYQRAQQVWCLPTLRYIVPQNSERTHFEIKYLQRGETCWELEMTKPANYHTHFDYWQSQLLQQGLSNKPPY